VRNHQRRRRLRVFAAGAVAAGVIAVLAIVGTRTWSGHDAPRAQIMQPVSGVAADVNASVRLARTATGSEVTVECDHYPGSDPSYPSGPAGAPSETKPETTYRLVVFNKAGATQWPASWPVGNDIKITTTSSWMPQNISKIVIQDDAGNAIFQLNR
jgi:hypothetical protein